MNADALTFTDPAALADLGTYAARARTLADDGGMRLVASGAVLAAWVGVQTGTGLLGDGTVLGLRTVELAQPATLDVVVPLAAVTERVAHTPGGSVLPVPPTRALAPWSALTPPRSGWAPDDDIAADDLAQVARDGIAQVADAVTERGAAAGLVRDQIWRSEIAPGVPAAAALGAYSLGFLAPGSTVHVFRAARWTRLSAAGGHLLMR